MTKMIALLSCLFLYFGSKAQAQPAYDVAYAAFIYGRQDIDLEQVASPQKEYLTHYTITLQHLLFETIDYQDYNERSALLREAVESVEIRSPDLQYFRGEMALQAAMVGLKNQKQLESVWLLRKAYKLMQENVITFPHHLPSLKTLGLLEVILGAIPEKYTWLLSLVGMEGSISHGLARLQQVIDSETATATEATLIRALLLAYVLDRPLEAWQIVQQLDPATDINRLVKMTVAGKAGKSISVINLFEAEHHVPFTVMHYQVAEAYLQQGNYENAEKQYVNYLHTHVGLINKKDSYYKRSLIAAFQSHEMKVQLLQDSGIHFPATYSSADQQADQRIKQLSAINLNLMKLRLAIDGGFYERADSLMGSITLTNQKDTVELYYRIARLHHKTGAIKKAKEGYLKTINSPDDRWYFAPNAALQLGYIYYRAKHYDSARHFFETIGQYKHYPYERSISSKARAGLNQIADRVNVPLH